MYDRLVQYRLYVVKRTILVPRDLSQGTLVGRFVGKTESRVKDVGRNMIGMGDMPDGHPALDGVVLVHSPVHCTADRAVSVKAGKADDQKKSCNHKPLLPPKAL